MNRLLKILTPWYDEEESDMKVKKTDEVVKEARETVDKTQKIVSQYRLAGVIIAQERHSARKQ